MAEDPIWVETGDGSPADAWDDEPSKGRGSMLLLVLAILAVFGLAIGLTVVAVEAIDDDRSSAPADDGAAATTTDAPTATTAVGPVASTPVFDATSPPNQAGWPAVADGAPLAFGATGDGPAAVGEDVPAGVYVWSDFTGWHVWVVNGDGVAGVRGRIDSDQPLVQVTSAEPGVSTVAFEGTSGTFELPAAPRVSGVDLGLDFFAENLVITLEGVGAPIAADQVHVGATGAPSAQLPLVIQKREP